MKMNIYFAAPLFAKSDLLYNADLVNSEIGVAFAKEIPVLGLYTDSRQQGAYNQQKITALKTVAENQFHYLNLYTVGLIKLNGEIYSSENALLEGLAAYLGEEQ